MTQIAVFIMMAANAVQGHQSAEAANAAFCLNREAPSRPRPLGETFLMQFVQSSTGRLVRILLDGRRPGTTEAGKLVFRDGRNLAVSVCANVRAPLAKAMTFPVTPYRSSTYGGNVAKAGNIVAKFFREAQSADQCAGLQLAVWEAIEDGGAHADFRGGRFAAESTPAAIAFAEKYYEAIAEAGDALYLEIPPGGGPSGSGRGQPQLTATSVQ